MDDDPPGGGPSPGRPGFPPREALLGVDPPTRGEIGELARYRGWPAVSIVLLTDPLAGSAEADRAALGKLISEAGTEMTAAGDPPHLVRCVRTALTACAERISWSPAASSVAIYGTVTGARAWRLPCPAGTLAEVAQRFFLKPMLRAVGFPHHFLLLRLGHGPPRLLELTAAYPVTRLPRPSAGLQRHGADALDDAHRLIGQFQVPVVITGDESAAASFRARCAFPHLILATLPQTDALESDADAVSAARVAVAQIQAGRLKDLRHLFHEREAQGLATSDPALTARAAARGLVETLLVDLDSDIPSHPAPQWDGMGACAPTVAEDLALRALMGGASIVAARRTEVPGGREIAAILRAPIF